MTNEIITGEAGRHLGAEPPVPWWSFTKTVLADAVLTLVSARRLNLDEPVAGAPYTLRHLLQHTAGLPDYGPLPEYHAAVAAAGEPWPPETLLRAVKSDELLSEPGTSWAYSNVGYLLVRQTIEQVTRLELGEALHSLVLGPIGTEGVCVAASIDDLARTAWGNDRRYDPRWVYHGLLVGPPSAAASVLHELLFGALLSSHLKEELLQSVGIGGPFPGRPFVAPSYGLGVMIDPRNALGRVVGHTGQGPGSTGAVYSFLDLPKPRTLAGFIADDRAEALGTVETRLLNRVRGDNS